ncbi:SpaA isopeptide-forming pilin-related protein [Chitinophaga jiangningensis]|nr:SpaA isopeptide-forming pilin-related protein [Chitinophaga jiangningensis]
MKKISYAAALLVLAACSTSDPVIPVTPPVVDSSKVDITVYDATKWAADKPYGQQRAGVTVNLYKSQADFADNKIAFTRSTDVNGKAQFTGIPDGEYYIEAKLDTLSNMPWRSNNEGYTFDSLYQQYTVNSPMNDNLPYGGNFIYKDLNGDGVLDTNDYTKLPAQKVSAAAAKTNSIRIMIGVRTNSEFQPFTTSQEAKDALNVLYNDIHAWHQLVTVADAVLTQDANCNGIAAYCDLDTYKMNAFNNITTRIWNNGISLINKANRMMQYGVKATGDSSYYAHAIGVRGYVKMQLADLFGSFPNYNTLLPLKTIYQTQSNTVRTNIEADLNTAYRMLPALTSTNRDRSKLSKEATNALLVRNALNNGQYATAVAIAMPIFDNDSAVILEMDKSNTYTSSTSREILWGDNKEITNADLKVIFKKGNYLPIINLNQLVTTHAEAYAQVGRRDEAIGRINMIASRSGLTPYPQPWSQSIIATMEKIQLQTFTDQAIEGITLRSLVRWNIQLNSLGPLGFQPHNALMPVPMSFVDQYPNIVQNPGY